MSSFSILCALALIFIVGSDIVQAQNSPADYLKVHNAARSAITKVKIPNLVWDKKVAAFANNYANQRKDCKLAHSSSDCYGENIAVTGPGGDMSGIDAVTMWVGEKPNYDYNSNSCAEGKTCGHYTQVVWKNTTRIGCAKVKCENGGHFITCNYDPPGNYFGERPY